MLSHTDKTFIKLSIFTMIFLLFSPLSFSYMLDDKKELEKLSLFQDTVSSSPVPTEVELEKPIKIAIIYPSADISDFWVRNFVALTKRLTDLKIPFEVDQFTSRQIEHSLQTHYTEQVLKNANSYDFVIFGPSELSIQANNIQSLSKSELFKTFIWAFHTPDQEWSYQPDGWFDFSSAMGARVLCQHVINHLGTEVNFAANRGIPGITDTLRSQGFIDCVEENGNWSNMYEHFGQYQKLGGADGAKLVLQNFPEVKMLHNANTAMTMGALDTLTNAGKHSDIYLTGWGGTAKEIDKIRTQELDATPMRVSDDLGVATAEAMKYFVEKREKAVPLIYLGRISVVHSGMSEEELAKLTQEAFRYSGL